MKLLTWCDMPNGERCEVWDGLCVYGTKAPYYVRYTMNGVTVAERTHQTAISASKDFERTVEEKTI